MIIVGLTGSIGMGKSTVAAMFVKAGIPLFDADAEVHRLQGPAGRLIAKIEAAFPGTTGQGGVDRQKLGAAVFGNPQALARLERIVHPAVARERSRFLRRFRSRQLVILDVPLLFERSGWRLVNHTIVVSAPAWKQRRRVLARPGMTAAKFARIKRLQMPDFEKCRRADFIIYNGGHLNKTAAAVRKLIACLTRKTGR